MPVNINQIKAQIRNTEASNRNPLYDSHIYWSQKPYNICDILIEGLSEENDIVFDPFLGSGVTLLEAVNTKHKRIGIGCEINDAPLFIIKTLLSQISLDEFRTESEKILKKIHSLQSYYTTRCPQCNNYGTITSIVFDKATRQANPKIKVVNYRCSCSSKCTKNADNDDYNRMNLEYEISNITDEILIPDSKLAVYENQPISQIFTKRNFKVLDELLGIIKTQRLKDVFSYILMSILHLCKITDKHSNSQWPLWIPKTDCVEKNIIDIFEKKLKKFESTIKYVSSNYTDAKYTLLQKGSQYITDNDIKNDSVQLIITDPPYLGQVAYSEYMQLYRPFLGLNYNIEDEIVVSSAPSRNKTEEDYFVMLDRVFEICSLKLKDNGYFCMYFHDCNLSVWDKLITSLSSHNLRYISQIHISKSNTLKNIISPKKSLNGDCILFFVKEHGNVLHQGTESLEEIEINLVKQAKGLVRQHGSLSTPELYDNGLMEVLIQNGWLSSLSKKYKTLVEVFEKHLHWDSESSKWTYKSAAG